MTRWIDTLTDQQWRNRLGQWIEAATGEIFNVMRWATIVAFARFLSIQTPTLWFQAIHWITGALLFGYLASRFLLRPEVPIFSALDQRWKRVVQALINYGLCLLVFILVMWGLNKLVDGIAHYRFPLPT